MSDTRSPVRVDFYVIGETRGDARERTACRIAEKAWQGRHRVFVHTASAVHAQTMDALLWTFRPDSFVPHAIDAPEVERAVPILVGAGASPSAPCDVLVNLTDEVPEFRGEFRRIAEIVGADDTARQAGRARYRRYRDDGCEIASHNV